MASSLDLGGLLSLSEPQFLHLKNGRVDDTSCIVLL